MSGGGMPFVPLVHAAEATNTSAHAVALMTSTILRWSERAYMFQNVISTVRGEAGSKPSVAICSCLDVRNGDFRVINYRYVNELGDASYGPADIDAPRLQLR